MKEQDKIIGSILNLKTKKKHPSFTDLIQQYKYLNDLRNIEI